MNNLGAKIKRLREQNLLSRKELAAILQCSTSHAINIEKGSTGLSDEKKRLLSKHFDLPDNYFNVDADVPIPNEFDCAIGANIREKRKEMNLTQTEFAEEIGYSGSAAISAVESGKRSVSKKKLVEIAEFFDIHVAELLMEKNASGHSDLALQKIISDFYLILNAEKKPSVYDKIIRLIEEGCRELRQNTL